MHNINYPSQTTYYIYTQTGETFPNDHGFVETTGCLGSGKDTEEKFLIEQDYLDRLTALGIDPEPEII